MSDTVVILGAGATKACGGPLTAEILPAAIRNGGFVASDLLERFLVENFHLPKDRNKRKDSDYPSLPLLISLVDTAIDRKQSFGPKWNLDNLSAVRRALEQNIFNVIKGSLRDEIPHLHRDLLSGIQDKTGELPIVITLNYDVIIDNTIMKLVAGEADLPLIPNYGTEVFPWSKRGNKPKIKEGPVKLLKLHGSLNWLYCPGCQRLNVAVSESLKSTFKQMEQNEFRGQFMDDYYIRTSKMSPEENEGTRCEECENGLKSIMITPTHLKDYRNPHISSVWYHAERALQKAKKVIFIGYSLPEDDVEVIYLLKRGLNHISSEDIVLVEKSNVDIKDSPVGRRYRTLFGESIRWEGGGFQGLVNNLPHYLN